MRKTVSAVILLAALASCRTAPSIPYKGRMFYTKVNIWYNPMQKDQIMSTNYHMGEMLPAGTPVRVLSVSGSYIRFQAMKSGEQYRLRYIKVYVAAPMQEYFHRMFDDKPPVLVGRFSEKERRAIMLGEVEPGMSKAAVLMSWGWPPAHQTTSIDNNNWRYWMGRTSTKTVKFHDDEVVSVR